MTNETHGAAATTPATGADVARPDPFDARLALRAEGLLRVFNEAGVLDAADVHVAGRLGALVGEAPEQVLLAVALAVRAPRLGHVHTDLASVATDTVVESEDAVDLGGLPWPDPAAWVAAVGASALVLEGDDAPVRAPLRLLGTRLALDRYWHEERRVADDLRALDVAVPDLDEAALASGLARLFAPVDGKPADPTGAQARAAETAVRRRFTVVAGGPGTGKTTTVGRIVALLLEQADALDDRPPLVALAAPTGKAAARMEESLRETVGGLDVAPSVADALGALTASTLHRLLGWRPDARSRFRHHRGNRLPHDVVIVDETSMVSLSLMARLVEAVRPDARLILVGDPGQLVSVEAGAVLGDIVGPAREAAHAVGAASAVPGAVPEGPGGSGPAVVVLRHVHRFGERIAALAEAVSTGDADEAIRALGAGGAEVTWLPVDVADAEAQATSAVRDAATAAGQTVRAAAADGDALGALRALESFRLLCAHRRGPYGAREWMRTVERWLTADVPGFDPSHEWYVGRPLLITQNDYGLKLYNGDTGVVVRADEDRVSAAFERSGGVVEFAPGRLGAVDTVHAMTIHRAQGSQFGTVAVVVPPSSSPLLTRELLYTGLTRARQQVIVVGTEAAVRRAVDRPAGRASGLRQRLWGEE